jgi:O-antigen/teichoic acid export membrane protein
MKISLWGHIITGVAAFSACAILFPLFFPQYVASLTLFAALLISLPLRGLAVAATEWYYASAMQKELFFTSALPKALTYVLLPLFLWLGGIIGYVAWYMVSSDIVLQARIYMIGKRLGSTPSLRFLFVPDATDVDIVERIARLLMARFRRFFGSVA